jgi:AhpD family alkylhydroperoxidase
MTHELYPDVSRDLTHKRRELAPDVAASFHDFGKAVFASGALSTQAKHIIAVAVAHVTQCAYCIRGHTRAALREGASQEQLMEAIWVAAEMRAGASFAHSLIAISEMSDVGLVAANGQLSHSSVVGARHEK